MILISSTSCAAYQPPALQWYHSYGGAGDSFGTSVVRTEDGGYAVAGYTNSSGNGGYDVYLVRTDAISNMLWSKTYGGQGDDVGHSIVRTADGGYAIVGYSDSFDNGYGDVYLVRTDASGNLLWNKTYGKSNYDSGMALVQTRDGGFALAGLTCPHDTDDWTYLYLVRTDADGNMLWNQTYGGNGDYTPYSLVQTSDGGYAIVGARELFDNSPADAYLIRTDANGNLLWGKTYGGPGIDSCHGLVQMSDGGFALSGFTNATGEALQHAYLVRTDASGNMLWNKTYKGSGSSYAWSLALTSDGGFIAAGYTCPADISSAGVYLVRTDASGNMLWNGTYGGYGGYSVFEGWSIVGAADGSYVIAGLISPSFDALKQMFLLETFPDPVSAKSGGEWVLLSAAAIGLAAYAARKRKI